MSEFNVSDFLKSLEEVSEVAESLEAPKVKAKAPRKPRAPKVDFEAGANGPPAPLLLEEPVPKRGKGRPPKLVVEEDENEEPVAPKPKRKQSELQKLNFIKALETRKKNIELRKQAKELEKQVKEEQQEAKKQIIEKKVLKKAKCLKKRELLEQTALDDLPSDEDIPDAIIEKVIKKQRAKAKAKDVVPVVPAEPVPVPKYNFV